MAASKKTVRRATTGRRSKVTVTKSKVVFSLSAADRAKAAKCLEKSGTIRFSFKEISATSLPHAKDDGVLID